mgnify:CR=1 FL=1
MEAVAKIIPAQLAYMEIPANSLRDFFDGQFPYLAKCPTADFLSGNLHRYKGGHDLFLDVLATFKEHGLKESAHQAGHILLTDFPTKAGIPIPGFSISGAGEFLQEWGISAGWVQMNICDAGIAFIAISESHPELCDAFRGLIDMNTATFFDTFVEGSVEVAMAFCLENPFLLIAGAENILAGVAAAYHTVSVYVDPLSFFGGGITSALIGFFLTKITKTDDGKREYFNALRGGFAGAAFAINPAFGLGAICALLSIQLGKFLSQPKPVEYSSLKIDANKAELFLNAIVNVRDNTFDEFVNILEYNSGILAENFPEIPESDNTIAANPKTISWKKNVFIPPDNSLNYYAFDIRKQKKYH